MIKKCITLGAMLAIGFLLAGCFTDFGPVASEPVPIPPAAASSYLELGDRVTVTVYGEADLTGIYDVNPNGDLNLPLIGQVKAVGRTATDLQRDIGDRYKRGKFLDDPKVTVAVVQYRPVYIFGEVTHPGPIPYLTGLNVLTAVTTAGGLTYRADKSTVLIQHPGEQAWTEYPMLSSVTILPGDLIRVPERYF
jgi:protein involved in polysaccharide export with SLBB domain